MFFFFFKQKTAYEMRISDWSSDVCSSDLQLRLPPQDRLDHPAAQCAVDALQPVGAILVEAEPRTDRAGHRREAAGDQCAVADIRLHGGYQRGSDGGDCGPLQHALDPPTRPAVPHTPPPPPAPPQIPL